MNGQLIPLVLLIFLFNYVLAQVPAPDYNCGRNYNKNCTGKYEGYCCYGQKGRCSNFILYCTEPYCDKNWGPCGVDCGASLKKKCGGQQCCSKSGKCGITEEFCGETNCDKEGGTCGMDDKCGPKVKKSCTGKFKGQCCHKDGVCGESEYYCKASSCDKEWGRCGLDDECGPELKKKCSGKFKNDCCNKRTSKCGNSSDDCSKENCLEKWGVCKTVHPHNRCGPDFDGKKCTGDFKNACCSKTGYCGSFEENCGVGCLIKYGKCGNHDYCGRKVNGVCTGDFSGQCCSKKGKCGKTMEECGTGKCLESFGVCNSDWLKPRIFKSASDGKCLQYTAGLGIDLQPCDGSDAQIWFYNGFDEKIKNKLSGKCLRVGPDYINFDFLIHLEPCDSSVYDQKFQLRGKHITAVAVGRRCLTNYPKTDLKVPYLGTCYVNNKFKKIIDWNQS